MIKSACYDDSKPHSPIYFSKHMEILVSEGELFLEGFIMSEVSCVKSV